MPTFYFPNNPTVSSLDIAVHAAVSDLGRAIREWGESPATASFVFRYNGLYLPMTRGTTVGDLSQTAKQALAERAQVYATGPIAADAFEREICAIDTNEAVRSFARRAVSALQVWANLDHSAKPSRLLSNKYVAIYGDVRIAFNPFLATEEARIVETLRTRFETSQA